MTKRIERSNPIDRRQFLARAACAGAAGGLAAALPTSGLAAAAYGKRWEMKLSCSSINFASLPIEQAVERIAALGFDAVDVWSAHAGCPHLDDVLNRLGPDGLKQLLAKHELDLYSFSVYSGGYARYAELLGSCGGGVAVQGSAGPCDPAELTTRMKAFLEGLKPLGELAEKHNSYLAIENHGHALLDSVDSFKAFTDLNDNPRLGIALAPYHVQGLNQSVEEAIAACGSQLFFIYAWQKGPGEEQLPGIGPADCAAWLAALAEIDYKWCVNPFMHHEPEPDRMSRVMAESVRYLKETYDKAVPS